MGSLLSKSPNVIFAKSIGQMTITEFAYYLAFSLYFLNCVIDKTTITDLLFIPTTAICDVIQVLVLLLLILKFLLQKASVKGWFIAVFVVLVGFVSWRQANEGWLFWLALFVVCAEGVKLKYLATIAFSLSSGAVFFAALLSCTGIIENATLLRDGVVRYAMGFKHPNTFGMYILIACMSFSVLRFGRSPIPDIVLLLLASLVILNIAGSRTSALLAVVQALLLVGFYFIKNPNSRRKITVVACAMVVAVIAISFYFMMNYDSSNPVHVAINAALSGRLRLANGYYQMQSLTLFGSSFQGFSPIYWEDGEPYDFVVDNAYCHLVLRYGLIPTIFFLIGLFLLYRLIIRENRWDALFFGLLLMSIYGLSENFGIRIECNYFLFALGAEVIFRAKESRRRKGADDRRRNGILC